MDIKTAMALSLLGIKKENIDNLMSINENNPTTEVNPDVKKIGPYELPKLSEPSEPTVDNGKKNEPNTEPNTPDYKKMYDELKTTSDKLQSDLKALQAHNTSINIEPKEKKETLTDIFKDIL